jgi:F-type H+-transporting ATPase subunit b
MAGLVEISIGRSLLIQVGNFLLLLLLLNTFLFKPIIRFLESRHGTIHGNREAARAKEREAQELLNRYLEGIERANREASEALAEVRREAELKHKEMLEAAREEAHRIISQATEDVKRTAEAAREGLREETRRISMEIAQKLLGRSLV